MLRQRLSLFKAGVLRTELDSEEWRQAMLAEATTSQMLGVTLKFQVRQAYQVGCDSAQRLLLSSSTMYVISYGECLVLHC